MFLLGSTSKHFDFLEVFKPHRGYTQLIPAWLSLEQAAREGSSLPAPLNSPVKINKSLHISYFIIRNSTKIWSQISSSLKVPKMYRGALFFKNHHDFKPSTEDPVFARWREKGVGTLGDPYGGGHLMSFEQLKAKHSLPASHFLHYLQTRNFTKTHIITLSEIPLNPALEM